MTPGAHHELNLRLEPVANMWGTTRGGVFDLRDELERLGKERARLEKEHARKIKAIDKKIEAVWQRVFQALSAP